MYGLDIPSAINIEEYGNADGYSDARNTSDNGFENITGGLQNDIIYTFSITKTMDAIISNCGSQLEDTRMYLCNASASVIAFSEDYYEPDGCANPSHAYIKKQLSPGKYYIICEGYDRNGWITTNLKLMEIPVTPVSLTGNSFADPVIIGTYSSSFTYTDNTRTTEKYNDSYGVSTSKTYRTNDIFYKFVLGVEMDVIVRHCGSFMSDTYVFLLKDNNGSKELIDFNDDRWGVCENIYQAYCEKTLSPGTYYVITEGFMANGFISTTVEGSTSLNTMPGNTFANAINIGQYSEPFSRTETANMDNYSNAYGQTSHDVFYKFSITNPMTVTAKHCGSILKDTYVHILTETGERIGFNDDNNSDNNCSGNPYHAFLAIDLPEGTYYIVSEGYMDDGIIETTISGEYIVADFEYTYDVHGQQILRKTAYTTNYLPTLRNSFLRSAAEYSVSVFDPGPDPSKYPVKTMENTTGIDAVTSESPMVYPNPVGNSLTVYLPGGAKSNTSTLTLISPEGKVLNAHHLSGNTNTFDVSALARGMYIVHVKDGERTFNTKIVKK
jgi:hypothetical protein